jgi:hypothetical protein
MGRKPIICVAGMALAAAVLAGCQHTDSQKKNALMNTGAQPKTNPWGQSGAGTPTGGASPLMGNPSAGNKLNSQSPGAGQFGQGSAQPFGAYSKQNNLSMPVSQNPQVRTTTPMGGAANTVMPASMPAKPGAMTDSFAFEPAPVQPPLNQHLQGAPPSFGNPASPSSPAMPNYGNGGHGAMPVAPPAPVNSHYSPPAAPPLPAPPGGAAPYSTGPVFPH